MRPLVALCLAPLLGCSDGASPGYPDAGPDLIGIVQGPDACGPYAQMVVGERRTWIGRFGQGQFETQTTVELFDADGFITETVLSGDPDDVHGEGTNRYQCDEQGLRTAGTSFRYVDPSGTIYFLREVEYDPPLLRVRRTLAVGDRWEEATSKDFYQEGFGGPPQSAVFDVFMEYRVAAEQIVATAAGSWPSLLVEGIDQDTGQIAERDWRVEGVGDVMFATYQDGVPGFSQELAAIEHPSPP